jgi:hypothetical protein
MDRGSSADARGPEPPLAELQGMFYPWIVEELHGYSLLIPPIPEEKWKHFMNWPDVGEGFKPSRMQ